MLQPMPRVNSQNFGAIEFIQGEQFVFANGLPGFPQETEFLPVEVPEQLPLLYLQSLRTPELCFAALPVKCILSDYELSTKAEDLACIGLNACVRPGPEMLCLALLCFGPDGTAAANLRAPIIINVRTRRGAQMIQNEDRYSIRFPLRTATEVTTCS